MTNWKLREHNDLCGVGVHKYNVYLLTVSVGIKFPRNKVFRTNKLTKRLYGPEMDSRQYRAKYL